MSRALLVIVFALGACSVDLGSAGSSEDPDPEQEPEPELTFDQHYCDNQPLPPRPLCHTCVCCLTCTMQSTLDLRVDGTAASMEASGAAVYEGMVALAGTLGDTSLAVEFPAALGTYSCATDAVFGFIYYADGIEYRNGTYPTPRLPCSLTVTAIGEVGARIEGMFSATLADGDVSVELTAGSFSVVREVP